MRRSFSLHISLILLFTALGMAVMGYHPAFEDGGIYLTAVKANLNPALYPHDPHFFRLQMQATFFDKWVADSVRWTSISVDCMMLLWQFAAIALIVFGCWSIARRLFPEERAQWAGVALVTAMFTLPVAGTALYLVDQHLHPRALATGFILLAVSRILSGKSWQAIPLLLLALLMHPIMAVFGISFCFFLTVAMLESVPGWLRGWSRAGDRSLVLGFVPLGWLFEPTNPISSKILDIHTYFFLYRWEWYEWLGALAPLFLFWLLWRIARRRGENLLARFALAVFLFGVFQQIVAMVQAAIPSLIRLTPLQPMRFLHLIYFFLILIAGCLTGKYLLKASVWRWAVFLLAINGGIFASQEMIFTGSEHIELPGMTSSNPWEQAFAWIRQNTPTDALFVLDPNYMAVSGEDYQSFRALAERSQLADNIKDTAAVALIPEIGPVWARQVEAQGCNPGLLTCPGWSHIQLADFERLKAEFGVDWALVSYPQPAGLDCGWHNDKLAVCRIP